MAESHSLIDDLVDPGFWAAWFERISQWLDVELFAAQTLIELAIIALAALIARPLSARLCVKLQTLVQKHYGYALLKRVWQTSVDVAFQTIWFVLLWMSVLATDQLGIRNAAMAISTSLIAAWVIVSFATVFVANAFWSRTIAISAWIIAALNIVGLLDQTVILLDGVSISLGQVSISLLTIVQGIVALGILLWLTAIVSQIIEGKLKNSKSLTPSIQVLSIKLVHIGLATFAFVGALAIVGVDLTALAVFGGAIGVGLGFGMQKIFANLMSGFILLLDRSIKPGDVIAVSGYYGRVDSLGARYVSVMTRDGIEHLIPNEELIITRVENWSHSHSLVRLRKVVGVHYKADVHKAIKLCIEAMSETPRILQDPEPNCLMKDFADSSVNLEMRYWINDPMSGRANVTSDLMLRIWDKFHEHDIEIPYPQRDLHLRSSSIEKNPEVFE